MTYFPLEPLQKLRRRDAVQLSVVELEGHRQGGPQPLFPVLAPDEEGVVVASGVDVHRAVDLVPRQGGGSDDHVVLAQFIALSALPDLPGERPVVPVKLLQVVGDGDVTGGDTAVPGGYHRIDGQAVILHQLVAHRKQVEVLHPGRRLSDAPAEEHIEFAAPLPAPAHQCRHIQGLHQGHHGHGGLHPQLKGQRPGGAFGINFSHTLLHSARQIRFGRPGKVFLIITQRLKDGNRSLCPKHRTCAIITPKTLILRHITRRNRHAQEFWSQALDLSPAGLYPGYLQ